MSLDLDLPLPDLLASVAPRIDERIASLLPRRYDAASLARECGGSPADYDAASMTEALADPIWHYLDAGGKRWRPALMLVAGAALGVDPERLLDLGALCEMIHNATLLVDDIEDDSPTRRGRDCAHVKYGVDVALNAGNALYFIPLRVLDAARAGLPEDVSLGVYRTVAEEMTKLHYGQALDIAWHRGFRTPTPEQYLRMCAFKTGTLARMAVRIAAVAARSDAATSAALGRYAESLGVAFQIRDDILNVTPSALSEGKGYGEDIHEGKATLMVIHALRRLPAERAQRLEATLREHTDDPAKITEAIGALDDAGSITYAREAAERLVMDAWGAASESLPDNPGTRKLREFGEFAVAREI